MVNPRASRTRTRRPTRSAQRCVPTSAGVRPLSLPKTGPTLVAKVGPTTSHDPSASPDIIVLQKTHANVSLSRYVAHNQVAHDPLPHPVTAILTRRALVVNRADLAFPELHQVSLEVLPERCEQCTFYSQCVQHPSCHGRSIAPRPGSCPCSDSSQIPPSYSRRRQRAGIRAGVTIRFGRRLWQLAHDLNFSLLIDPTQPTRIGNSVCRHTTPYLSFCRSVRDARWSNTHHFLGSDHYVLTIQVNTSLCKPRPHTTRHTDWDAFRKRRLHSAAPNIEDLSTWTDQLLADLDTVTASIITTEDHPAIDSRLAHLWAARTGLANRWHTQPSQPSLTPPHHTPPSYY
ncbi:hypothetical protein HPB51_000135 [Rhipicephalus microplus]|uniref:Tick transposon n=1 Tax=Rhipicephalus microplus TaxID=6941 RepID=A0A9J6EK54_RHIMP|nr:hypothetical protein HPB51_000135 [Rhipicephalus microplus]